MSDGTRLARTTHFARHLGSLLDRSGLSLRQAAASSGIPHQTIFNWLNGRQPRWYPRLLADLQRLCAVLAVDEAGARQLVRLAQHRMGKPDAVHKREETMSTTQIPNGWFPAGSTPQLYQMGLDPAVTYNGRPAVMVQSRQPVPSKSDLEFPFGTLMQWCKATQFRGKRLRFAARVLSEGLDDWAGLWLRIDGYVEPHVNSAETETLAFDNMESRPITGSSPWTQHEVVLDVPDGAEVAAYGILLGGNGSVWMSDVTLNVVGDDVAVTAFRSSVLDAPTNLSFGDS